MAAVATKPIDAARAVLDLADFLRDGSPLSPEARAMLLDALDRSIISGFAISIDEALGLRGQGGLSVLRHAYLGYRDKLIVRLWRESESWRDLPPSAASRAMRLSADLYERTAWKRERASLVSPVSDPSATWWEIKRLGIEIPDTKRLRQILSDAVS